ncbi:MAG: T9SS type A sorting domain-containing protein [Flavobacteriales bacterium]|nr:T9SS type A sorting domain-containing protein [Flavobacteriales bacterium]
MTLITTSYRHILVLLVLGFSTTALLAQDTIRVQTLTFSDITQRRGWYVFPDSTHTFRKVLMHHTLKCDAQTTQDQYACGEWDYLTYNQIHEHTGVLDSTAQTHPYFKVAAQVPPSVERASTLQYNERQTALARRTIGSVNSEAVYGIGDANTLESELLSPALGTNRGQYLITATELTTAGLQPGPIHELGLFSDGTGAGTIDRFVIRLKQTSASTLSAFDGVGLTTVYDLPTSDLITTAGEQRFTFIQPFDWDGTSNLIVDLAVESAGANGAALIASDAPTGTALTENGRDGFLEVNDDFVGVDAAGFSTLGTAITITFRVWGDDIIPAVNTSVLEAVDDQGRRLLNIHLPWSDGHVYWDAGNDGGGYDRIDKVTVPANVEGQWNHWAFVKNTATGTMRIYLNGTLWHSGTGKTKPLTGITRMKLASGIDGNVPYPGLLDEVNVFAAEVSAANIAAWKDKAIDATHPNAADLLYSFHCDGAADVHHLMNSADPAHGAVAMGTVRRADRRATELFQNAVVATVRPDMTLVQADLVSTLDTLIISEAETKPLLTEEHFAVNGNVIVPTDTLFAWLGGMNYTFDPTGAMIDSIQSNSVTDLNDTLEYYATPFEVVNDWEIGRYITPYGINLTLGSAGFRWTYDVTDYQWMLRDSVDLSAGNQQELIDLEFEMIEGVPPRPLVGHQRPWGGLTSRSYADLSGDIALPPVNVQLSPEATQWSLRTRLTGHGHNSNTGAYPHCCEWKDNTHSVRLNGTQIDAWHIWQTNDCALNPVYPQGGTWLGSREGWCPGDVVKDHEVTLPGLTSGGTATLDYSITPVPSNNLGMGGGNYVINMDLMEYGPAAHQVDAEIYEVKRPSRTDQWRRENPICRAPMVVLRNAGAQDLTSATFTYQVSGGTSVTYNWTGLLKHMQHVDVELPIPSESFWAGDADREFTVTVSQPNGVADQYADNDSYTAEFVLPVVYTHDVLLHYKTNNRPYETSVRVLDLAGNVLLSRNVHTANTQYIDTLHLANGCYTFEMIDSGNDGLSYWADPDAGSGFARLKKPNGVIVEYFPNEFGRALHKAFTVAIGVGLDEISAPSEVSVQPNPSNGNTTLVVSGLLGDADMDVLDINGRMLHTQRVALRGTDRIPVDLAAFPTGLYMVRLKLDDRVVVVRAMKE